MRGKWGRARKATPIYTTKLKIKFNIKTNKKNQNQTLKPKRTKKIGTQPTGHSVADSDGIRVVQHPMDDNELQLRHHDLGALRAVLEAAEMDNTTALVANSVLVERARDKLAL